MSDAVSRLHLIGARVAEEMPPRPCDRLVVSAWGTVHLVAKPTPDEWIVVSYTPLAALLTGLRFIRFAILAWWVGWR